MPLDLEGATKSGSEASRAIRFLTIKVAAFILLPLLAAVSVALVMLK